MAYDEKLAERVRNRLASTQGITERKMFGGLCFLLRGNMCCGLTGETLMVRVGPEAYQATLRLTHAREMDFTGRPLKGMVYVDPAGLETAAAVGRWVERALAFAGTLPPQSSPRRGA